MTIGAISFQPYVYNVNAISPASMNRLSRISDDVLDKKTDYSGLTKAENENPLKPGQTMDFKGSNASRIMRSAEETKPAEEASPVEELQAADGGMGSGATGDITNFRMQQAINAYEMFMTA